MKHIKSIVSLLLTLTLALSLTACGSQANTEPEQPDDTPTTAEVNLYVLSGPTGIGAMNLWAAADAGETENTYHITMSGANDEVVAAISKGEADIAAVATNMAAALYNKTEGGVTVLAVNTLGVLSLLGDDGYPYGLPIDYWYNEADGKLYFHGAKEGHKIDAIRACDKASFCIHDEGVRMDGEWPLHFRSVIVFGRIAPVTDEAATALACKELSRKFTPDDEYFNKEYAAAKDRVLCLALTPEHMTGKQVIES